MPTPCQRSQADPDREGGSAKALGACPEPSCSSYRVNPSQYWLLAGGWERLGEKEPSWPSKGSLAKGKYSEVSLVTRAFVAGREGSGPDWGLWGSTATC